MHPSLNVSERQGHIIIFLCREVEVDGAPCVYNGGVVLVWRSKPVRMPALMVVKRLTFPGGVPLIHHNDGTIRLSGSRVTLDTLVAAFKRGDTTEEIHEGFPSVSIEHIKAAIGWYLKHVAIAEEYLKKQAGAGERLRKEVESQPAHAELRKILERRREQLIKP
jgi:uncharacterized protein (DUF433 family)